MTQNILNELKHRKVDLEKFFQEKVALEEKIGEDASEEDLQRLGAMYWTDDYKAQTRNQEV